jgi:RHS repeat-associated protein
LRNDAVRHTSRWSSGDVILISPEAPRPGQESTATEGLLMVYDAWNRQAAVYRDSNGDGAKDANDPLVQEALYDGLGRRIMKIVRKVQGETVTYDRTDYYYNEGWQCLEERTGSHASLGEYPPNESGARGTVATTVKVQWLWDIRYIDAPVLRWRDADANSENGLEETLYYANDANLNVTALVNTSGTVIERYAYDPYGKPLFFDGSWNPLSASAYSNEILYCGYRFDPETGLYQVNLRLLHSGLGSWISRDQWHPYGDGMSLREYARSNPTRYIDPSGAYCGDCCPPFDPKNNKYDVTVSEPVFTPGDRTPKDIDFSSLDTGLTAIGAADTVGGLASGGAQSVAEGGSAITGVLDSAAHVVADPGTFTGMQDAARQGVDKIRDAAIETGNLGGVSMFVIVKYKSCDLCWGFNPMRSWNPLEWVFSDYEMTKHETGPYRCTKGSDKMLTAAWRGRSVYRDKASALIHKSACQADAKAAFMAGKLK